MAERPAPSLRAARRGRLPAALVLVATVKFPRRVLSLPRPLSSPLSSSPNIPARSCGREFFPVRARARQPPLSYPCQHATVVVFIEFANILLSIRLSSLLCASLRARRVSSVVLQHSCLPLAHVNAHAPARCHCSALALRPSGFMCARVCRRTVKHVLPCS
jgi:hypothetical protein